MLEPKWLQTDLKKTTKYHQKKALKIKLFLALQR